MCGANRLSVQLAPLLRGAVIRSARRWLPLYIPALVAFVILAFSVAMSSSATAGCSGVGIEIGVPIPIIGSALVGSGGCKESTTEVHRREKQAVKPANSQEAEAPARPHKPKTLHKKSIVQNTAEPAKPHASKAARAAEINAKAHVRPHATLSAKAVPPAKAEPQPRQETRSQAPLDKKAVDPQLAAAKDAAAKDVYRPNRAGSRHKEARRPRPATSDPDGARP